MLQVAIVVPFVYHCNKIKIFPFWFGFKCVPNCTNTTILSTLIFSGLSEMSKSLDIIQQTTVC